MRKVWVGFFVSEYRLKVVNKYINQWKDFSTICAEYGYKSFAYRVKDITYSFNIPNLEEKNAAVVARVPDELVSLIGLQMPVRVFSDGYAKTKFTKANRIK